MVAAGQAAMVLAQVLAQVLAPTVETARGDSEGSLRDETPAYPASRSSLGSVSGFGISSEQYLGN